MPKRIGYFTIAMCFMLNLNIYLAGLTSTLTFEIFELPINKLDDLLSTDDYQLITYKGSKLLYFVHLYLYNVHVLSISGGVDEAYFSEATAQNNKVAQEVFEKMIKPNPERALIVNASQVRSLYC